MSARESKATLFSILKELNSNEINNLSPYATRSILGTRRYPEKRQGYRQQFALDADRILHSRAYMRYIDKTQVFCLVDNDHITHRVLHVQLVARIARTIGRFLRLNEDLIEAISLGHDIGHPPFGHDGESFLAELSTDHGLPPFQHNLQSVRFLDKLERKGTGWNLTLQVLDGILCHDGESHSRLLRPQPINGFEDFDRRQKEKEQDPQLSIRPSTPEGCVVRLADTIAYIGKDIEDAIILGLIRRQDIPENCQKMLGSTNGTIVFNLVTDLIENSSLDNPDQITIGFSEHVSTLLQDLKNFNYEKIYLAPATKRNIPLIRDCYHQLFAFYLNCLTERPELLPEGVDLMSDMEHIYCGPHSNEEKVVDFIAGMTDDYFLNQARDIDCKVPEIW
ncbi:MAG: HD domain-containing protein [Deltaproteobacteria bacterium]|nr:HD domain-containing protein [Deltaproteobacteria bacterium]